MKREFCCARRYVVCRMVSEDDSGASEDGEGALSLEVLAGDASKDKMKHSSPMHRPRRRNSGATPPEREDHLISLMGPCFSTARGAMDAVFCDCTATLELHTPNVRSNSNIITGRRSFIGTCRRSDTLGRAGPSERKTHTSGLRVIGHQLR